MDPIVYLRFHKHYATRDFAGMNDLEVGLRIHPDVDEQLEKTKQ